MQHQKQGGRGAASLIRVVGLALVLVLLLLSGLQWVKKLEPVNAVWRPVSPENRYFLPGGDSTHSIAHFPYYSICNYPFRPLPLWAACEWDARMEEEAIPAFFDSNYFRMDSALFARWKDLGSRGKAVARRLGRVYAVAGPVWGQDSTQGPVSFFCAWLDEGYEKIECVGMLLPNPMPANNKVPVILSIDSIESLSGLDLFAGLLLDSLENEVEKTFHIPHWEPEIRFNPYFAPGKN